MFVSILRAAADKVGTRRSLVKSPLTALRSPLMTTYLLSFTALRISAALDDTHVAELQPRDALNSGLKACTFRLDSLHFGLVSLLLCLNVLMSALN